MKKNINKVFLKPVLAVFCWSLFHPGLAFAALDEPGQEQAIQPAVNTLNLTFNDSDTNYLLSIDPGFEHQAYLKASNTEGGDLSGKTGDGFGSAVAISGDTLVVSAILESSNATGVNGDESDNSLPFAGAVYVFTRNGTTWSQQAYLKASNPDQSDFFGFSVAISGDTIVVGSTGAGAVHVFTRSGTTWSQQALLEPPNPALTGGFGFSVAISGNTIVVSGDEDENSVPFSRAVYVFIRDNSTMTWSLQDYLTASNAEAFDGFGWSVAIAGETLVVSAPFEDSSATGIDGGQSDNSAEDSGAAYVFTRSSTTWSQQAYLKASNTGAGDEFGQSVAISGSTVVAGTFDEASSASGINGDESDNSAERAGAAYVFARNDTDMTWSQQAYLKASNSEQKDEFGWSVAVSGETIVVGAWKEDSNATGTNGDQSNQSAGGAGAAYVFTRSGAVWTQQDYLKASNTEGTDEFGFSVAISGDTVVGGALREDSSATGVDGDQGNVSSFYDAGAAYVFVDPSISSGTKINAGHAGAWFYPATSGQGQFIDVIPESQFMFISWFTYTDAASANPSEHRWLTALGNYSGNTAVLDLHETLNGKFDDPQMVTTNKIGEVTVSFSDCEQGQLTYDIPAENLQSSFPMQRVIPGSGNVCEQRSAIAIESVDINAGMDGSWFDSAAPGQGFFIDAHPDPEGGNLIFVSWFTYGNDTASGQRWLTALGSYVGSTASMDVFETTGGSFDSPQTPSTIKVGTMSIDFTDCSNAQLTYALPTDTAAGDIAITRVIPAGDALCAATMAE